MNQAQSSDNAWSPVSDRGKGSFLAWLTGIGISLMSMFEQDGESYSNNPVDVQEGAKDADRPVLQPIPDCCFLARPDRECEFIENRAEFICPEGFQRTYWTCVEGTRIAACGECASGTSCYNGPWDCSIWFWVGQCE